MPVEIDLKAKRAPGRYPDIAKTRLFINEIEIIMQALTAPGPEIGLAGFPLVVPGLIALTRFHRRNYMNQTKEQCLVLREPFG